MTSETLNTFKIDTEGDGLRLCSLNVLYDPRISEDSDYHFSKRWPHIEDVIRDCHVVFLQEVHQGFLPTVSDFAKKEGYSMKNTTYHTIRNTDLVILYNDQCHLNFDSVVSLPGCYSKSLHVNVTYNNIVYNLYNVHFPLDAQCKGERLAATKGFSKMVLNAPRSIMVGDFNVLPKKHGEVQVDILSKEGGAKLIPWQFYNTEHETTFWGFPYEIEALREYNAPAVLDRAYATTDLTVSHAICSHIFINKDMAISDHMPCFIKLI